MSDLVDRFRRYIRQEQELPRVFRRDRKKIEKLHEDWAMLRQEALEAEGGRIWKREGK